MSSYPAFNARALSPLNLGLAGMVGLGVGLLFSEALSVTQHVLPLWAWFVMAFMILAAGLVLHVTTRRMVWIKLYVAVVCALVTSVQGLLVWSLVASGMNSMLQLIMAMLIATILVIVAFQTHMTILKAPERASMPHEDFGMLDSTNGLVDPSISLPRARRRERRWTKAAVISRSLLPLTAGLSMLLVRSLPASGDLFLGVVCTSFVAVMFSFLTGRNLGFAISSRRWERQHGKVIIVKRS